MCVAVHTTVTALPSASKCTVDLIEVLATVNQPAILTLTSRDLTGLPLDHVVDGFAIQTVGGTQDLEGLVEYRGAGNYSVSLTAPLAGEYVVRVTFDGEPLPRLLLYPAQPKTHSCQFEAGERSRLSVMPGKCCRHFAGQETSGCAPNPSRGLWYGSLGFVDLGATGVRRRLCREGAPAL